MDNSKTMLRSIIKELVEEKLREVSTSDGAGPYQSKFAFRGNSADGKKKAKEIATQAGYEEVEKKSEKADAPGDPDERVVTYGEKGSGALKKPAKDKVVQENRYVEFKNGDGSPQKKIGEAVREINRQIAEIDRVVSMSARLKKENNVESQALWKNTVKSLTRLEAKFNSISSKLRELKA